MVLKLYFMLFTAKIRLFYLYYIKIYEPLIFQQKRLKKVVQLVQVVQAVQNTPLKLQTKICLRKDHIPPQAAVEILMYKDACDIF